MVSSAAIVDVPHPSVSKNTRPRPQQRNRRGKQIAAGKAQYPEQMERNGLPRVCLEDRVIANDLAKIIGQCRRMILGEMPMLRVRAGGDPLWRSDPTARSTLATALPIALPTALPTALPIALWFSKKVRNLCRARKSCALSVPKVSRTSGNRQSRNRCPTELTIRHIPITVRTPINHAHCALGESRMSQSISNNRGTNRSFPAGNGSSHVEARTPVVESSVAVGHTRDIRHRSDSRRRGR